MNILFISTEFNLNGEVNKFKKNIYTKIGFYLTKLKGKSIYALHVNIKKCNSKLLIVILKKIFNKEKVLLVFSKFIDKKLINQNKIALEEKLKQIIIENIKNNVIVSTQNNIAKNDVMYIENYIDKKKLQLMNIKVLFIIDNIDNKIIQAKIEENIQKYKIVDIFLTDKSNINDTQSYINSLNEKEGTSIEIVNNINKKEYNILLIFSNIEEYIDKSKVFSLDYNDSDQDILSNTYLLYLNNKTNFEHIFSKLNINMVEYEKTKLGKLYILAGRYLLDI